jgi:tetratricopeptide (TPR) repeat protein
MSPVEHYRLVEDLFHTAIELGPAALDSACAGDQVLRAEVDALLASYEEWSGDLSPAPAPPLPRFGPYICDDVLGTGGMGTVYRAHRDDGQFDQAVAIKVLRGSLRSEWYRRRFLAERQILARLNHPKIARLLDGGMTLDGEPYLVMELVEGEPIDSYCDRLQLNIQKRIGLFEQVLDAVDYAHRNLVVHRDLKPSNILVTAEGEIKLLDFGMSKLVEEDAGTTVHRALTPRYASPEQLRGQPLTTATDIFSQGVMLYELFSGKWPFGDPESGSDAWRRLAQQPEPQPIDWTRIQGVSGSLAGDLTAIVFKSLELNPENRYRTAGEFSNDLRRSISGEPVQARHQTFLYRSAKFLGRNRWGVAAALLLALTIAAGVGATLWQSRRAERRFADVRNLANFLVFDVNDGLQSLPGTTALQRRTVERSLVYLDALLRDAGSDQGLRLEIAQAYRRLGDVLGSPFQPSLGDRAAAGLAYEKGLAAVASLPQTSAVRTAGAALRLQRGGTQSFGATGKAGLEAMRQAVGELRGVLTEQPANVELRVALAQGLTFLGARAGAGGGTVEALSNSDVPAYLQEAQVCLMEARRLAPADLGVMRALVQQEAAVGLLFGSSQPALSIAHYRKAMAWLDQIPAADRERLDVRRLRANILSNVGWAEGQSGNRDQAVRDLGETKDIFQAWAAMDPADTTAMYQLTGALRSRGIVLDYQGKAGLALDDFLAAAELHKRLIEKDPGNVVYRYLRGELLTRSGNLLMSLGDPQQARERAAEGLEILAGLADSPKATLSHIFGACRWLTETGVRELRQPARAAVYCRVAAERTEGKDPDAFEGLATALDQMGDAAGAMAAAEKAVALLPLAQGEPPSQQRLNMESALKRYRAKLR